MTSVSTNNPFVGLRPFRSDEGLLFFGRREQAVELLKKLHTTHFLAVVGSSGCGKSSLIQAGLIPRLTAGFLVEDRDHWTYRAFTPGDAPRARLATAFDLAETVLHEKGAPAVVAKLEEQPDAASRNCLLLVDQFEEIFSLTDSPAHRDEAADFVGMLLALAGQRDFPVFVVMTMRSDFLGDCDMFHGLPEAINQSHYLVPRLTRPHRQEAIKGPARLFGRTITPQLVDRVLNDLSDDQDQLPVMQHAMLRTWERWQRDGAVGPIDLSHYLDVGGVKEALSRDAEGALAEMSTEERQLAVQVFQALTDTDESNRPVRRYVRLVDLAHETGALQTSVERILDRFRERDRSFVVVRQDADSGDGIVHISHESLIRQWGSLRTWVDEERVSRDQYLRLVDLADRHARGQEGLLPDPGLQLALDWRENTKPTKPWARRYRGDFDLAMAYLASSEAQREDQRQRKEAERKLQLDLAEEKGRSHARAALLRVAIGVAMLALVAAIIAVVQWRRAERETNVVRSSRLATHAGSLTDLDQALLWGAEALRLSPTFEAESSLFRLLGSSPHVRRFLHGHTAAVFSVAFAPYGHLAASAGRDGKVILWNLATNSGQTLIERGNAAYSLAFSPVAGLLASGFQDGAVVVWNTTNGRMATLRKAQGGRDARAVSFNTDGTRLAVGDIDGTISVWTHLMPSGPDGVPATTEPVVLTGGPGLLQCVAFSPGGAFLASGHWDGSVWLWDLGRSARVLKVEHRTVSSLAFSPDGRMFVSGSTDWRNLPTIRVWSLRDGVVTLMREFGDTSVRTVALSRDGKLLAAGSDDHTIRLWRIGAIASSLQVDALKQKMEHASFVRNIAFGPDGASLISGDEGGKVILWDLEKENLVDQLIDQEPEKPIQGLAWSLDGKQVAWADDRQVSTWNTELNQRGVWSTEVPSAPNVRFGFSRGGRLGWSWINANVLTRLDVETGERTHLPVEILGEVPRAIDVGRDDRLVAFATQSSKDSEKVNQIAVWDLASGRHVAKFDHGERAVNTLALSPDGTTLASDGVYEGLEHVVIVREIATRRELAKLTGRDAAEFLSLAFSPDGRRLAAGSSKGEILVWNVRDRRRLGVLSTGHNRVTHLAFSPDGQRLASADGTGGAIRVWNISLEALQARACHAANRQLTEQEWSIVGGADTADHNPCGR